MMIISYTTKADDLIFFLLTFLPLTAYPGYIIISIVEHRWILIMKSHKLIKLFLILFYFGLSGMATQHGAWE